MPDPAPELVEAMGLAAASNQHPVEEVKLTAYTRRTALKDALTTTNQEGRITPMGDIIFSTAPAVHQKFSRCNYSVSLVTCNATVPGAGAGGIAVDLNPDTYMFLDDQRIWTEKHLTGSFDDNKDSTNLIVA